MGARLTLKRNLEFVAELVEVHNPDFPTFCDEFLSSFDASFPDGLCCL
jgi:hypothetical protein